MSGGHFDYRESYLGYIAEQLEYDIEYSAAKFQGQQSEIRYFCA